MDAILQSIERQMQLAKAQSWRAKAALSPTRAAFAANLARLLARSSASGQREYLHIYLRALQLWSENWFAWLARTLDAPVGRPAEGSPELVARLACGKRLLVRANGEFASETPSPELPFVE